MTDVSTRNKTMAAFVTPLVMQVIIAGLIYAGIEVTPQINAALTSVVTGLVVWAAPVIIKQIDTIVDIVPDEPAQ
jgi:hypothetical protein